MDQTDEFAASLLIVRQAAKQVKGLPLAAQAFNLPIFRTLITGSSDVIKAPVHLKKNRNDQAYYR